MVWKGGGRKPSKNKKRTAWGCGRRVEMVKYYIMLLCLF
jgi:hypothetical protein